MIAILALKNNKIEEICLCKEILHKAQIEWVNNMIVKLNIKYFNDITLLFNLDYNPDDKSTSTTSYWHSLDELVKKGRIVLK